MLRVVLRFALFMVLLVVVGELFFRYVVVASNTAYKILDPEFKIMLHDTSGSREGIYTTGRFGLHRTRWHINRQGWKSDKDYQPPHQGRKPVIAIIGDSYIAGFQVEDKDHLTTQLADLLQDQYFVYNFGQGGSCSSQFLHIAMYVRTRFDPDIYVILARDSDWRQSITYYVRDKRIWQIRWKDGKFVELPAEFEAARLRRLPKYSAIIRYFVYNVNLDLFGGLHGTWRQKYGSGRADPSPQDPGAPSVRDGMSYLVHRIREEIPDKDIIFMSDANLKRIYEGTQPYGEYTVPWLREVCAETDCHILDLGPPLARSYASLHERLDFKEDYHWNPLGHRVVAETLYDYLVQLGIVASDEPLPKFADSQSDKIIYETAR